jgi:endonuclease-8
MPEGDTIHYAAGRIPPVHRRAGLPCPRCGADSLIRAKGQGDDNRRTFWCPRCQS